MQIEGCHTLQKQNRLNNIMQKITYKTKSINKEGVVRDWWHIDATNIPLGRLATKVATYIRGKHKPYYTPHVNCGDKVIITNADKVKLTGKKMKKKAYIWHTGYPGGQKSKTAEMILSQHPERLIEHAVKGMLPKNKLRAVQFKNMFVYAGDVHEHAAQNPETITL